MDLGAEQGVEQTLWAMRRSLVDSLDRISSPRSSVETRSLAFESIERHLATAISAREERSSQEGLDHFLALQLTFECNIPLRLLAWMSNATTQLEGLIRASGNDENSGHSLEAFLLAQQLKQALSLLQGITLNHVPCKDYLGRRYPLEVLLELLLTSRHMPALTSPSRPASCSPSPGHSSHSSNSSMSSIKSNGSAAQRHLQQSTASSASTNNVDASPPESLSAIVLDTLLCILVDSSGALRAFEQASGPQVVVRILKRAGTPREVRMKCLEFLYFYLLDETGPAEPNPAAALAIYQDDATPTPSTSTTTTKPTTTTPPNRSTAQQQQQQQQSRVPPPPRDQQQHRPHPRILSNPFAPSTTTTSSSSTKQPSQYSPTNSTSKSTPTPLITPSHLQNQNHNHNQNHARSPTPIPPFQRSTSGSGVPPPGAIASGDRDWEQQISRSRSGANAVVGGMATPMTPARPVKQYLGLGGGTPGGRRPSSGLGSSTSVAGGGGGSSASALSSSSSIAAPAAAAAQPVVVPRASPVERDGGSRPRPQSMHSGVAMSPSSPGAGGGLNDSTGSSSGVGSRVSRIWSESGGSELSGVTSATSVSGVSGGGWGEGSSVEKRVQGLGLGLGGGTGAGAGGWGRDMFDVLSGLERDVGRGGGGGGDGERRGRGLALEDMVKTDSAKKKESGLKDEDNILPTATALDKTRETRGAATAASTTTTTTTTTTNGTPVQRVQRSKRTSLQNGTSANGGGSGTPGRMLVNGTTTTTTTSSATSHEALLQRRALAAGAGLGTPSQSNHAPKISVDTRTTTDAKMKGSSDINRQLDSYQPTTTTGGLSGTPARAPSRTSNAATGDSRQQQQQRVAPGTPRRSDSRAGDDGGPLSPRAARRPRMSIGLGTPMSRAPSTRTDVSGSANATRPSTPVMKTSRVGSGGSSASEVRGGGGGVVVPSTPARSREGAAGARGETPFKFPPGGASEGGTGNVKAALQPRMMMLRREVDYEPMSPSKVKAATREELDSAGLPRTPGGGGVRRLGVVGTPSRGEREGGYRVREREREGARALDAPVSSGVIAGGGTPGRHAKSKSMSNVLGSSTSSRAASGVAAGGVPGTPSRGVPSANGDRPASGGRALGPAKTVPMIVPSSTYSVSSSTSYSSSAWGANAGLDESTATVKAGGVGGEGVRKKTTEEKKELLGTMLGNVDALVEGVRQANVWGLKK